MKQFGSIAKAAAQKHERDEEDFLEYTLVDREVKFYYPGSGALAYVGLTQASAATDLELAGSYINFVVSLVEPEDARYIKRILLDHASGFDIDDLTDLMDELMDQWSNHPSKPGSGSAPTSAPTGRPSTAASRRAGSTRSTSRSTASSTRAITS